MYTFKRNDIIILLGAGASVEAGVPHSIAMIREVEKLIDNINLEWSSFRDLYHCVRSAIYYGEGIKGREASYNIERLVGTLEELAKRDEHPLYPFVGAWTPKLVEVAGSNFEKVQSLRDKIIEILRRDWIEIERYEDASYYEGLVDFQRQYAHPLRIFTLNYDLCVELACRKRLHKDPERGFESRKWDWRLFEDSSDDPREIFLYKLHGSTDWKYDKERDGKLTYVDSTASIQPSETALIFATTYKLQYVDPFLFLAYEFRKWTLDAKLIISIGYGFGDNHINGIIGQALNNNPARRLLCVSPFKNETPDERAERIEKLLELKGQNSKQVECWKYGAKEFMMEHLNLERLASLFPNEPDLFDEVSLDKKNVAADEHVAEVCKRNSIPK